MIRPFLFILCAIVAVAAAGLGEPRAAAAAVDEPAVRFHVRAPSGGGHPRQEGQVSAATLFGLVKRTGCTGTSLTGPTCPQGRGCCYYTEECCGPIMCLVAGETCCSGGQFSCGQDETCCGSGCMPDTATCCGDGTWSSSGLSDCGKAKIRAPAPTFTDARYGLSSTTTRTPAFTYSASTPTFSAVSGGCAGAQKVIKDSNAATYKGGGHGGGGGGSSSGGDSGSSSGGSSSGGSSSGDSSSDGSSSGGTTSGGAGAGCASSASMVVRSMGTLIGAFWSTIVLM